MDENSDRLTGAWLLSFDIHSHLTFLFELQWYAIGLSHTHSLSSSRHAFIIADMKWINEATAPFHSFFSFIFQTNRYESNKKEKKNEQISTIIMKKETMMTFRLIYTLR